jgi:hypothetical protein
MPASPTRDLPAELEALGELALDLRWTWSHEAAAPTEVSRHVRCRPGRLGCASIGRGFTSVKRAFLMTARLGLFRCRSISVRSRRPMWQFSFTPIGATPRHPSSQTPPRRSNHCRNQRSYLYRNGTGDPTGGGVHRPDRPPLSRRAGTRRASVDPVAEVNRATVLAQWRFIDLGQHPSPIFLGHQRA